MDGLEDAPERSHSGGGDAAIGISPIPMELKPGTRMGDGTTFVCISPDTNEAMYVTENDVPVTMGWKAAKDYAAQLDAYGHKDWALPTSTELLVLFNNRAAIGGFNESGSEPAGWYWSSSENPYGQAWDKRFSDGRRVLMADPLRHASVRVIRRSAIPPGAGKG